MNTNQPANPADRDDADLHTDVARDACPASRKWSDAQLELYADEEMEPGQAEALSTDLLADASLRARLAQLGAIDRLARRVLIGRPVEPAPRFSGGLGLGLVLGGVVSLAAAALLAMLLWPTTGTALRPSASDPRPSDILADRDPAVPATKPLSPSTPDALERAGVRVLAEVGARPHPTQPRPKLVKRAFTPGPFVPVTQVAAASVPDRSFQNLIDSGDVEGFLARTRDASPDDRDAAFGLLGGTLRSAMTAQSVLDKLSPEEQLGVCAVWAREPRLRPVTFERLALLKDKPELRERVAALATELSRTRELLAWVRSYGLETLSPNTDPARTAG